MFLWCLCFSLQTAHEQLEMHKRKLNSLDDYEQRIGLLRDDFSYLNTEKSMLQDRYAKVTHRVYRIYMIWLCFGRLTRSHSPSSLSRLGRSCSSKRSESPTRAQLTNSSRHARLISCFNDLYAGERLEAQAVLHRYIDDLETVQRIIFIAVAVRPQRTTLEACFYSGLIRLACVSPGIF